jgi:hypothetical protein
MSDECDSAFIPDVSSVRARARAASVSHASGRERFADHEIEGCLRATAGVAQLLLRHKLSCETSQRAATAAVPLRSFDRWRPDDRVALNGIACESRTGKTNAIVKAVAGWRLLVLRERRRLRRLRLAVMVLSDRRQAYA